MRTIRTGILCICMRGGRERLSRERAFASGCSTGFRPQTARWAKRFRTKVASDVVQDGQVLIPAGAEIDGRVTQVSSGHVGGHGTMHLNPEVVILPDGTRYTLHAEISGTPGSRTRIGGEGAINPGSRVRRDEIEYGGTVGAGVVTGAVLGGPVGAVTGGLIGAGAITVHLMVSHPQATLEEGAPLLFTLTEPLDLVPAENVAPAENATDAECGSCGECGAEEA